MWFSYLSTYMIGNDLANSLLLDQALFEESNEACKIFSDLKKNKWGQGLQRKCVSSQRQTGTSRNWTDFSNDRGAVVRMVTKCAQQNWDLKDQSNDIEERNDLLLPVALLRVDPLLPVHIVALWKLLFLTIDQTGVRCSEGQLLKDASLLKQPPILNHPLQKTLLSKDHIFMDLKIHTRLSSSVIAREFLSFSLSTSISSGRERWSWSTGVWLEEDWRAAWFRLEENTEFSSSKLISDPSRLNGTELGSLLVSDPVVRLSSRALMVWLTWENFRLHWSSGENADTDLHTLSSRCLAALICTMILEVGEGSYLLTVKQCPFWFHFKSCQYMRCKNSEV